MISEYEARAGDADEVQTEFEIRGSIICSLNSWKKQQLGQIKIEKCLNSAENVKPALSCVVLNEDE